MADKAVSNLISELPQTVEQDAMAQLMRDNDFSRQTRSTPMGPAGQGDDVLPHLSTDTELGIDEAPVPVYRAEQLQKLPEAAWNLGSGADKVRQAQTQEALDALNAGRQTIDKAAAAPPAPAAAPAPSNPNIAPALVMPAMDITAPAPAPGGTGGSGPAPAPTQTVEDAIAKDVAQRNANPKAGFSAPGSAAPKSPDEVAWERAKAQDEGDTWKRVLAGFAAGLSKNPELIKQVVTNGTPAQKALLEKTAFLQQQKEAAQKNAVAQREAEASDPNSTLTKRNATMLYAAYGIKPAPGFTADQTADYVAASKLTGEQRDKALDNLRADAAQRETVRHNRADEANERAKLAMESAKTGAAGKTPLPPESVKTVNQLEGVKALNAIEKAFGETNGTGVLTAPFPGNTAANRYHDAIGANSSALAAALLPQGRETPGAVEMVHKMLPGALTDADRAKAQFKQLRDTTLSNARSQINTLEASGKYDPGQLDELKRQLAAAEGSASGGGHPQDSEAIAWAHAHPQDPRSARILALNGG